MEVEIRGYKGTIYKMTKYDTSTMYEIVLSGGLYAMITIDKVSPAEIKILNNEEGK